MGGDLSPRTSCARPAFVTFPSRSRRSCTSRCMVLYAAGLTFLRRLARDRWGTDVHCIADADAGDKDGERRYVSVSNNTILQRALHDNFSSPDKALILHVIDVGKVRGQKRIHVRREVNPNVSPEPVERLGLVFPTLSVNGLVTPTAVEIPSVEVTHESLYEQMSRSMFNYRKDNSVRWSGRACSKNVETTETKLSQSAFFVAERDYTQRNMKRKEWEQENETQQTIHKAGVPVAVESVDGLLSKAKHVDVAYKKGKNEQQVDNSNIPVASVVETDTTVIPSDYVMLELQNGAGFPEASAATSSRYFISSRWSEQADEMSASMRLERSPMLMVEPSTRVTNCVDSTETTSDVNVEDSFVILERHEL
ncbi:hypothetical protein Plhal703r1_c78g0173381 [Plasmopara halstedii]